MFSYLSAIPVRSGQLRRQFCLSRLVAVLGVSAALSTPAMAVRVAMVKGFADGPGSLPVIKELNDNWDDYGPTRVIIDRSLIDVASFDLDDLNATGADVLWISNPAGGLKQYSEAEIEAIKEYASAGHHVFGTFRIFRFDSFDNRDLAAIFGLPIVSYNIGPINTVTSFNLIDDAHPIFAGLSDPFVSMGFPRAQAPNDDGTWDAGDLGTATLLALTGDEHGAVTFFDAKTHHAVYCSVFVEFVANPVNAADTRFLYNVLTLGATPTGSCCPGNGTCDVVEESECEGVWTQGASCDPNPCPQLGACCGKICSIGFESECEVGTWTEGIDCVVDDDQDGVIDACDRCLGFSDFIDSDKDFVPDGCDKCPGFNDFLDADGDGAPDACDLCPGSDDRLDADGDGAPDDCDICPGFDDHDDCDGDETPDGCDSEPDCNQNGRPDHCEIDDGAADCDGNGVPDDCQRDSDRDGIIDPCDNCDGDDALIGAPCDSEIDVDDCASGEYTCDTGSLKCTDDPAPDGADSDGDGVFDCNDLCPGTPPGVLVLPDGCRPMGACCFVAQGVCFDDVPPEVCDLIGGSFLGIDQTCDGDPDNDEVAGCDDGCPFDRNKAEPGQCGCGQPDTDTDNDGTADCNDECPDDPNKIEPGLCGCGVSDADSDNDGVIDCEDECPNDPNKREPGQCGCGVPDIDSDDDGKLDCDDECPNDPEKVEPGVCGCGNSDVDSDSDGTPDCVDNCPADPAKTEPGLCGCNVTEDLSDLDGDGVIGCFDECPNTGLGVVVDEHGCPMQGACCFKSGAECINATLFTSCTAVGGRYQGNGSSCMDGCLAGNNADIDSNGKIDLTDTSYFVGCMTGPDPGAIGGFGNCFTFDLDNTLSVDLADFATMQNEFAE